MHLPEFGKEKVLKNVKKSFSTRAVRCLSLSWRTEVFDGRVKVPERERANGIYSHLKV